uniref:60S acidic ribosomal protein P0 n=1 Tax=Stereomyxa ramosa TaxID=1078864 RepID=A0A7S2EY53_9EUKA|mmetsp:Transcript_522/g.659  ORF Transcript_522/g.659 Transcript_522/m.659 type:complete len:323 (+) Transcript_522:41-1009(+)|eukprot:CAMPEP_0174250018 /NCGR_PEP_ID=MMETSP0439-20130205/325_1 /TAXON_ID=0 /ORGANISM="Stereomyxa ramosa, Strain Chinc5" /LENGTH=322 /DNA_ID=CAMNT_0015329983 /DNA_START=62 /DNA_END=1030 /DNA_ORIENTATION=+
MVRVVDKQQRKKLYRERLIGLLKEYDQILLVSADNVGSNQMQKIRMQLRGKAVVLMGKNTLIRKAIRDHIDELPQYEVLLPHLRGNTGFVFSKAPLNEVRSLIMEHKVSAAAKAGAISPLTVVVPKGPTGMEPTKTSFFQALQIPTRISRGVIEIINDVPLLTVGQKVSASQAVLLQMLNILPFSYGLQSTVVYDRGDVYDSAILDLSDEDLLGKFFAGVNNIAALSLSIGYPTLVSVPHSLINSFRSLLAISIESDYTFKQSEEIKELLADPEKLAAMLAASASSSGPKGAATEAEAADEEESESEEEADMGGMFGDEDGY